MTVQPAIKDDVFQEQVIQAAQRLFQQHGMHKVTMDDVARAVGKGRSSLYYYYKSKEEILDAVFDVEIGEILAGITEAVARESTAERKIHAFCTAKLQALKRRRALYNTVDMDDNEIVYRAKAAMAVRQRYREQESVLLQQILTEGIKRKELKPISPKDLKVLVFVLRSGLKGLIKEVPMETDDALTSAIDMLTRIIIHGLKAV
jgi:AcrR family transcriptional regulator